MKVYILYEPAQIQDDTTINYGIFSTLEKAMEAAKDIKDYQVPEHTEWKEIGDYNKIRFWEYEYHGLYLSIAEHEVDKFHEHGF